MEAKWGEKNGRPLTSSTVFLRLVSVRVSSTKLSQRPLQSSGSSEKVGIVNICQPADVLPDYLLLGRWSGPERVLSPGCGPPCWRFWWGDPCCLSWCPLQLWDWQVHVTDNLRCCCRCLWVYECISNVYMRSSCDILTVFYHFLPRHPESFGPTCTSGKAGRSTERRQIGEHGNSCKKAKN